MSEKDNIDSLMEDMGELGITKVEVDIEYGVMHGKQKEVDFELAQDLIINGDKKIRKISGQAYSSLLKLEIIISDETIIYFQWVGETSSTNHNDPGAVHPKVANHIKLYYTRKGETTEIGLLNEINALSMNGHINKYSSGRYSPVEFFYVCINLTPLCGKTETNMLIMDNEIIKETELERIYRESDTDRNAPSGHTPSSSPPSSPPFNTDMLKDL